MHARNACLLLILASLFSSALLAQNKPSGEELSAKQKLVEVQDQTRALQTQRESSNRDKTDTQKQIREHDLNLAALAKELQEIGQQVDYLQAETKLLKQQQQALQEKLDAQREVIAALLRSAHALGRHQGLKLVLSPDHIGSASRLLAYHQYIQADKTARAKVVLDDLAALEKNALALQTAQQSLSQAQLAQQEQQSKVIEQREVQSMQLASLDRSIKSQSEKLAELGRNQRELEKLLQRLQDVIGDIPTILDGSTPISLLRGRLPWPVQGKVLQNFGSVTSDGRKAQGVVIAATVGFSVKAISHGRVAYADWLQGYGLMMFIDHGEGYLSLYGANETLLKDVGDWVKAGEAIATVGNSGGRADTALYFELRRNSQAQNPMQWLQAQRKN